MPPRGRKRKASAPPRRPPARLDYRSRTDGAWYASRLVLQGGLLRVMFEDYIEEWDEWYNPDAGDLASSQGVAALRARFRVTSPPLDDARCGELRPGQRLCVICATSDGQRLYYDAVLDSVKRAAHGAVDGEERCACRFRVEWTEGPRSGDLEEVGIVDVCCVQNAPVQDPVLSEFLDFVTNSFGNGKGGATASSQATGATLAPGGEGGTAPV
uniref:Uncharacterized protein n=1 Tax=Avena sativa TaxID=4498 RepID=A0ACD5TAH1_AVESA